MEALCACASAKIGQLQGWNLRSRAYKASR